MAYAVDFVLDFMTSLSEKEPVLFQRDGALYVVSEEGFGCVSVGLADRPVEYPFRRTPGDMQPPEMQESEDAILGWGGDKYDKRPLFRPDHEPFIDAIIFGPDSYSFCLDDMMNAAIALRKLPDDGKILMVSHVSNYRNHKYGYAVDGIDVFVQNARVMDRGRYLELLRAKEDELVASLEASLQATERGAIRDRYTRQRLPESYCITPNLRVCLPRKSRIHLHRAEPDSWSGSTIIESNFYDVDTFEESPYGMTLGINAVRLNGDGLSGKIAGYAERLEKELADVRAKVPHARAIVDRLNDVHNRVCAGDISWMKEIRSEKIHT